MKNLKNVLKLVLITLLMTNTGYCQMVVTDAGATALLNAINSSMLASNTTSTSNKAENLENKLLNAKTLAQLKKGAKLISEVRDVVRKGQTIQNIYNTEVRILNKSQRLRTFYTTQLNDIPNSTSSYDKTLDRVLDSTGDLIDRAVQLTSSNIFKMNDYEREKMLNDILARMISIERIIDAKTSFLEKYEFSNQEVKSRERVYSLYDQLMEEKRKKINEMN